MHNKPHITYAGNTWPAFRWVCRLRRDESRGGPVGFGETPQQAYQEWRAAMQYDPRAMLRAALNSVGASSYV